MVTEKTITIRAIRLKPRLLRVVFPGGRHLVAGGRLVLEELNGVKKPHPELPEYTAAMLPAPIDEMDAAGVAVAIIGPRRERPCSEVRACTLLFNPLDPDEVRGYIRRGRP